MVTVLLFLAISQADKVANDWNRRQTLHPCQVEVPVLYGEDTAPSEVYQSCRDKVKSLPPEVPAGYHLVMEAPFGWMLVKDRQKPDPDP
jgi:hypothetical protein